MLSHEEIDKRLAHLKSLDRYDPDFDDRCVEALETAKRLYALLAEADALLAECGVRRAEPQTWDELVAAIERRETPCQS